MIKKIILVLCIPLTMHGSQNPTPEPTIIQLLESQDLTASTPQIEIQDQTMRSIHNRHTHHTDTLSPLQAKDMKEYLTQKLQHAAAHPNRFRTIKPAPAKQ